MIVGYLCNTYADVYEKMPDISESIGRKLDKCCCLLRHVPVFIATDDAEGEDASMGMFGVPSSNPAPASAQEPVARANPATSFHAFQGAGHQLGGGPPAQGRGGNKYQAVIVM